MQKIGKKKEYVVLYRTLSNWTRPVHCTQKLRFDFVNVEGWMRVCGAAAVGWYAGSDIHIAAKKQIIECATFFCRHPGGGTQVGQIVLKTARY